MYLWLYLILSTTLVLLLGIIWNSKDIINIIFKIILIGVGIFGLIETLILSGYIIKV